MEDNYANELNKQGWTNLGKMPKFTINQEHFSCTTEKKTYAHTQYSCILILDSVGQC